MLPSFPSITFPNHWTLVTGLYPEAHGIVGNEFYDPNLQETFIHKKPIISTQPKWWSGEPIWKTASSQNKLSGVVMWPGSGIPTMKPDYFLDYDRNYSAKMKMDTVLDWLDLPIEERPQMISVYIPQIDQKGHGGGPDGPQMNMVLKNMDDAIGHLLTGLEARNLNSHVHVVIVSDHGMAATHKSRVIYYDDILSEQSLSYLMEREAWPLLNLRPKYDAPLHAVEQIYNELYNYTQQHEAHYRVFLRQDVPNQYHYSNNDRIAPIVVIPDVGYSFQLHKEFNNTIDGDYRPRGIHGYDNQAIEMRAIFMARGPRVERKFGRGAVVKAFQNTEVYEFVAGLLNLNTSPNNCTLCNDFEPL
ncbi:alkaline-phosphatase-like protein [Halteromyces radiatus]|uniref:alkaline-phosphatase-like protein n=1 Tax=Halteromyces radiatus TaxID=101107 RepID=UPI002220D1EF|nr:alkaline-phosphatase-like protein [Halteromyces radiatus]KAI8093108.1 alkaline-phosphatase-like protein [Halteromyces radiatus]